MRQQAKWDHAHIDALQEQLQRRQQRFGLLQHLQREYQRKGSAALYTFGISSNVQLAENPGQFRDALREVVKELTDMHRYQVTQKLGGGRLNIHVAEATEPAVAWIEQWFGGALSPTQARRLRVQFALIRDALERHVIVTPDEPIVVDGAVRHAEKHIAAHTVSDILHRLDERNAAGRKDMLSSESVSPDALPLWLGWHADDNERLGERAVFPLTQMVHVYISGTTGGGKSYLARVLIEEAAQHERLSVLVLDPRNQSSGLLTPEDRPKLFQVYDELGIKREHARGFDFSYYAPSATYAPALPHMLSALARGRSIVSFKGMNDHARCEVAAQILDAVFESCSDHESETARLLVVVDEAQLFTRKRVDDSAKEAAASVERSIDKIAREGRKFGIVLALVSQSMKDFSYDLASIRQMTTTKIFLRNSDREIEYASDIVGDGRLLVQLPTGTALVHNANWGVVRIRVRPPLSKVFEPAEAELRRLLGGDINSRSACSTDAQRLLAAIAQHVSAAGPTLNISRAMQLVGITSKRRFLELIDELERARAIRTRTIDERGRPRVIELACG